MSVATRYYPMDVGWMTYNGKSYREIFTDCQVGIEIETETSKAAQDILNSDQGFEYAIQRGRGWTVRLGSVVGGPANARMFGFNITTLVVGGPGGNRESLQDLFSDATIAITKEFSESRAARDAVGANAGWRYPRARGQRISIDLDMVVDSQFRMGEFDQLIGLWQPAIGSYRYDIEGGGFRIIGSATPAGGDFGHTTDASSRKLRLTGQGMPSITPNNPGDFLYQILGNNLPVSQGRIVLPQFQLSRPGTNNLYHGYAYVEEANLKLPLTAAMQGATLRGFGPLNLA